ncbi:hypothetical protein G9A89_012901 [Geosiphon pyriformis]|nr:hypothetical protein G9A89_012901 [Geosiphon pyriformis]
MSLVLGDPLYFNVVRFLKIASVAYGDQLLDKNGSIASAYLSNCLHAPPPASLASVCASVLNLTSFADIRKEIHGLWANEIDVYTDSFLRNLGMFQVACGAAIYFSGLNKGLEVEIHGILSSTLAELQAVALALECVPISVSVALHTDSQAAIDACVAELGLLQPDCHNSCWIERCYVVNLIESKDLTVRWIKVKGYAGIAGNVLADTFAEQTAHSEVSLPARINCRYVVADGRPVSSNARHFVHDIFRSICKFHTTLVWHPDSHMLSGSTCRATAALCTYFMKAVYFRLPVAVQKRLYNKDYPGVSCLFCGDVELPDHGFTCVKDASVWSDILGNFGGLWRTLMGPNLLSLSFVLRNLSLGVSDVGLYLVFCKRFVLKSWMDEATASFGDKKKAAIVVVDFVCRLAKSHRTNLWLFKTKFRSDMERSGLIGDDVVVASALGVGALPLSAGTVRLIGVLNSLDVGFSFRGRFLFLSGAVHRATIGCSIAVIKKTVKVSGFSDGFRPVLPKKKRKRGILENGFGDKIVGSKVQISHSWGSETGNTTKSDSIEIEEKCLVEETSFNYDKGDILAGGDSDQMPTGSKIKTKKAFGKPLGKINFSVNGDENNIILDALLELFLFLKSLVNISVCKFFTLNIGFKWSENCFQKSMVLGGASTLSKFAGIIRAMFTSESSLAQASKKADEAKILVNSNLKKSSGHSDQTLVLKEIPISTSTKTVHTALSEFGIIKSIKIQLVELWQKALVEFEQAKHADLVTAHWSILIEKDTVCIARSDINKELWNAKNVHKALLYTLPIETNAHNIWDYVTSARYITVCFDSAKSLNAVMKTIFVLKKANLHWSYFVLAKCTKCEKLGHIFLSCSIDRNESASSVVLSQKTLSNSDKSRLAAIYIKCSALVTCPVFFGGVLWAQIADGSPLFSSSVQNVLLNAGSSSEIKPTPIMSLELSDRFATLECSLTSLTERVNMLAKRLDIPEPTVSQLSLGSQPLVTPSSQNQGADIVISESLGVVTGGETVAEVVIFDPSVILKMEETLNNLSIIVMSLLAKMDNAGLVFAPLFSQMNNPAKQKDIICWHKKMNNLVSIISETKLKDKVHLWIMNKFDGVRVFTSGVNSDYLNSGIAIIIDNSLASYVCKVSEVSDQIFSVKLFFKNKLSADDINSLIAKTVNKSSFVILGSDFNKDNSHKCTSFRKCFDLGLVNALAGSSFAKMPIVENYFDTDHVAISVSVSLGGLLDVQLNSLYKQTNKNHWKFDFKNADNNKWKNFKNATLANVGMFSSEFAAAIKFSNLDVIWNVLHKIMNLLANKIFRKKWFKDFDNVFTKSFLRFYKLELLVSKIVKASCERSAVSLVSLMKCWNSLNSVKALVVQDLIDSGANSNHVHSALSGIRKTAIEKRMDSFETNKDHIIRSVLERPFHKVVLNYLVIDDKLILEPNLVKSKFSELIDVVSDLSDSKAIGLLGITNKLWKHCDKSILDMFLSEGAFTNICPITLIETAHKILSNRISLACSTFDVLHEDNFLVLKSMMTQFSIFTVRSVVENDMQKAYDSFFGGIHRDCTNRIITNFGLMGGYCIHNGLDQEKAGLSSFFAAGTFVDNTIWINNISINNDKTVAILVNSKISNFSLFISGLLISIAKKGESYQYLDIFLSTESFSKPSLAKTYLDVWFFTNLVLKKTVLDKQFLYLVLAVLHPIVSYKTQFNFVLVGVYNNLSLSGPLVNSFWFHNGMPMLVVLSKPKFVKFLPSLWQYDIAFVDQLHDHYGAVFDWYTFNILSVYTDGSLKNLGTAGCRVGAAAFFGDIGLGLGVGILSLMSSTLAELQAIALALECVPLSSSVYLFSDS